MQRLQSNKIKKEAFRWHVSGGKPSSTFSYDCRSLCLPARRSAASLKESSVFCSMKVKKVKLASQMMNARRSLADTLNL